MPVRIPLRPDICNVGLPQVGVRVFAKWAMPRVRARGIAVLESAVMSAVIGVLGARRAVSRLEAR